MKNLSNIEISTEAYKILQQVIRRLIDSREPIDNYCIQLNVAGRPPEDVEFLNEIRIKLNELINEFKAF